MVSDDGTSNSSDLGADVDEKVGGLARIVGDIFSTDSAMTKSSKANVDFKPKGMFLGSRRDNEKPIDIPPQVLARHAAMLGSTGSGKTVMAKALIEEAAIAKIPSLIIDPQGDLARLALGLLLSAIAESVEKMSPTILARPPTFSSTSAPKSLELDVPSPDTITLSNVVRGLETSVG